MSEPANKNGWLKFVMAGLVVGGAVVGGLTLGPAGAVGLGMAAAAAQLPALFHDAPKRKAKKDRRGQVEDDEEPPA
jgi:hypothetical protein